MRRIYRFENNEPVLKLSGIIAAALVYPLYIWVLPLITQTVMSVRFSAANPQADATAILAYLEENLIAINLIAYIVTTVILLLIFGRFIFDSAKAFFSNLDLSLWYVPITALVLTYVGNVIASIITMSLVGGSESANNEVAISLIMENTGEMILLSAVLAPFCEEIIFRAAFFRPLFFKSKIAAVVLTALLFGLHHVWQAALSGDLTELVYIIQYIPSSAALVFCYCMFKNCFGAIIMHMLLNLSSIALVSFAQILEKYAESII